MLSPNANKLLLWLRRIQVPEIELIELVKIVRISKTAIRGALHELEEAGAVTIWED